MCQALYYMGFLFPFSQQVCELGSIIIITNEEISA